MKQDVIEITTLTTGFFIEYRQNGDYDKKKTFAVSDNEDLLDLITQITNRGWEDGEES